MYRYRCHFIGELVDDIGGLILGENADKDVVWDKLCQLAMANSRAVVGYWNMTERGRGIPDGAFKTAPPYFFPDQPPARTFRTSGTTGGDRGSASYSPHGLELMRLSITQNARKHVIAGLERPAVVRFVPAERSALEMIMAHGMELIAATFGDPELSDVVVGPGGIDYDRLAVTLGRIVAVGLPTVLLGSSYALAQACAGLIARGQRFELPGDSRVVDAGGFKGRSLVVGVAGLRADLRHCFGIAPTCSVNLFGMTELASQLYDTVDIPVGPLGERPKGGAAFVQARVLDPQTMAVCADGPGLLEVTDLCLMDRPPAVLTGDLAIATGHGPAIIGRVQRGNGRGCSLAFAPSGTPS